MDRGAKVLFSTAYREGSAFGRLWRMNGVGYITSAFAASDAKASLADKRGAGVASLEWILERITIVAEGDELLFPKSVKLVDKDLPILSAAILAKADFLLPRQFLETKE